MTHDSTGDGVLETALLLFREYGYDATDMTTIAQKAGLSEAALSAQYPHKAALLVAWHGRFCGEVAAVMRGLPAGTIIDRFHRFMRHYYDVLMSENAAMMRAWLRATLDDQNAHFAAHTQAMHHAMKAAFVPLVAEATDAPKDDQAGAMVTMFYTLHMMLALFWLYDRSANQRASAGLLDFMRQGLQLGRAFLMLPPGANTLLRLAAYIDSIF